MESHLNDFISNNFFRLLRVSYEMVLTTPNAAIGKFFKFLNRFRAAYNLNRIFVTSLFFTARQP